MAAVVTAPVRPDRAGTVGRSEDDRPLPVLPPLESLFATGGLRRGSAVTVRGSTSLLLALLAGPSRGGAWCGVVGLPGLGLVAAAEAGIALERLALVPDPGRDWAAVAAALLDAMEIVVVAPRGRVPDGDVRRLAARARQRGAVLVPYGAVPWPGADLRLSLPAGAWDGVGEGSGRLLSRRVLVRAEGRGSAARAQQLSLWLPAADGEIRVAPEPTLRAVPDLPPIPTPTDPVPLPAAAPPAAAVPLPAAADPAPVPADPVPLPAVAPLAVCAEPAPAPAHVPAAAVPLAAGADPAQVPADRVPGRRVGGWAGPTPLAARAVPPAAAPLPVAAGNGATQPRFGAYWSTHLGDSGRAAGERRPPPGPADDLPAPEVHRLGGYASAAHREAETYPIPDRTAARPGTGGARMLGTALPPETTHRPPGSAPGGARIAGGEAAGVVPLRAHLARERAGARAGPGLRPGGNPVPPGRTTAVGGVPDSPPPTAAGRPAVPAELLARLRPASSLPRPPKPVG